VDGGRAGGAVLGIDGCPGGWVGALVDPDTGVSWLRSPSVAVLLAQPVAVAGVDMPVGLPDGPGGRACDRLARARLGRRAATVFSAPVRPVLAAADYPQACAVSRAHTGRALSLQTWHLCARIGELDTTLGALTPAAAERVVEVHPELAFAAMTGAPLPTKHQPPGRAARLLAVGGPAALAGRPGGVPVTDCLDALAAAWTAARVRDGVAVWLPAGPAPRDGRGRPMRIAI
jgi:predicted RNase H-like nuclease